MMDANCFAIKHFRQPFTTPVRCRGPGGAPIGWGWDGSDEKLLANKHFCQPFKTQGDAMNWAQLTLRSSGIRTLEKGIILYSSKITRSTRNTAGCVGT